MDEMQRALGRDSGVKIMRTHEIEIQKYYVAIKRYVEANNMTICQFCGT